MNFIEAISRKVLVYDGSKGYLLQRLGLKGGECPELWNATHKDEVISVYKSYKEAGSDVIQTNTFQGSRPVLNEYGLGDKTYELNFNSVRMAKEAMGNEGFVAASVGPLGKLFEPSGELTFEVAYDAFKEQIRALADGGADAINFETFTDLAELRVALIAAKENTDLPIICSLAFEENGKTLMGTDPYTAAIVLKSLGADIIGTNCSFGPEHQLDIIKKMQPAGVILSAKPNAGLPEMINGSVIYRESPENFTKYTQEFIKYGVRLIGGCCGTTPEFISALSKKVSGINMPEIMKAESNLIASNTKVIDPKALNSDEIGELDACLDNELFDELTSGNLDFIVDKSLDIASEGYEAIRINVDKAENNNAGLLASVLNIAQGYIRAPFLVETANPAALEAALRIYKGRAGVIIKSDDKQIIQKLEAISAQYGSLPI